MSHPYLLQVVKIVGSRVKLAKELGVSTQRVHAWLNTGVSIPLEFCFAIEIMTRGKIKAEHLEPKKLKKIPRKYQWKISPL